MAGEKKEVGAAMGGMCKFRGCKHTPSKFSFCQEHFEHFKFGLINKGGEFVPDYEKKLDQFQKRRVG